MRNVLRRAALGIAFALVPMRVPADGGSQRSIILFRNQHPEASSKRPRSPAVPAGPTATAHLALPAIAPGVWFGAPALVGPFGNGGPPAATADMTATAEMNAFDQAITSDTGDVWRHARRVPVRVSDPVML
jgi:hypothetical protein